MIKNILIVAAHADDEVLGCGGTIARHVSDGDKVKVVLMADGISSRGLDCKDALLEREEATKKALSILGVYDYEFLGFPDNKMDSLPLIDIVKPLESIIANFQPHVIYTHHFGDLNIDHRLTHQAVMTACRPQPNCLPNEIYTFEVMSSTEWASVGFAPFLPNVHSDIGSFLDLKLKALEAYQLEMRDTPHSRSIEHLKSLALHRGNSVGMYAAESFMLMRLLKK